MRSRVRPRLSQRHLRGSAARFKVPERIVLVEAFPIVDSPNGPKVQRVHLREMAEALLREQRYNQPRDVPIGLSQR